ncbi:MAG: (Fe-S)-binding protein [Pseudomonadota bacterium]
MKIKDYQELIEKCSYCNFCQATCPVYLEDLRESHLARARVNLIQAALCEKTLPVSRRFKEILGRCLLCTSCTLTCPGGLPIDEIVAAARNEVYRGKRLNPIKRYLMHKIMSQRGVSGVVGKAQSLLQAMGWNLQEIPRPADRPLADRYPDRIAPEGEVRARVAYFVGCATNALYPDTGEAVLGVLKLNGIEVILPQGLVCCGVPSLAEGDLDTVLEMARTNIPLLAGQEVDAIITDCTSCGLMFRKKILKVLPQDDPLRPQAEAVAEKVWEVTDYLTHIGLTAKPDPLAEKFTYHLPCHRGWTPTLDEAPRSLLGQVPEAELVEMENPGTCCGAGGGFFLENRELSQSIRSHKLEEIAGTGVKVVLTQCPACRGYLSAALSDGRVIHPISLLAQAYRLEPPEKE